MNLSAHIPALIPSTLLMGALLVVLVGIRLPRMAQPIALLAVFTTALLSWLGFSQVAFGQPWRYAFAGWPPPIGIEFVLDGVSGFFLLVVNGVASLVLLHSAGLRQATLGNRQMPFYALSLLLLLGFNGMLLTGDLFNLYVFLEISSLASYALIATGNRRAPYAAYRYLIIGTVGGTLYLLGVGFLYAVTGTLNLMDMVPMLPGIIDQTPVVAALILMVTGIGIKAALFPMYAWMPEAYTNASAISSALIAPIGTKVAAYVLLRVLLFLFGAPNLDALSPLAPALGALAGVGILFGSLMAISQTDLKRMLAFSSVSQISYIVLGISLLNPIGFAGALFHVLNHAVMKACLFLVSGTIEKHEGHTDLSRFDDSYRRKYPLTMAFFTIAAISMIGLPPMAGFFSKWALALGTIQGGHWFLFASILTSSLLNAVYFFRILERVYLKRPSASAPADAPWNESGWSMRLPMLALSLSLILFGLFNAPVLELIQSWYPGGEAIIGAADVLLAPEGAFPSVDLAAPASSTTP